VDLIDDTGDKRAPLTDPDPVTRIRYKRFRWCAGQLVLPTEAGKGGVAPRRTARPLIAFLTTARARLG
jgi:hypothetical protein